jgi:ferrous iron transport protein B
MPFVSCAARLPIYILLASVFFPGARGNVVFLMYLASIVVVLLIGALADRVLMRGERSDSFVLELPSYRRPSARVLWSYVHLRVRAFVSKAGTVIFACALAVWFMLAIPVSGTGSFADTPMQDSGFASVAGAVSPALAPAGLDSWQSTGTLISGFVAKEVVVSTFEQTYGATASDDADRPGLLASLADTATGFGAATRDAALALPGVVGIDLTGGGGAADEVDIAVPLRAGFDESSGGHGGLAAVAFLAFVLLYVPCMATVAAIRHELGSRWAVVSVGLNLTVAWLAAVAVFQVGRALGLG